MLLCIFFQHGWGVFCCAVRGEGALPIPVTSLPVFLRSAAILSGRIGRMDPRRMGRIDPKEDGED